MSLNPLKEKGMSLDKQLRVWEEISAKPYNKTEVDCYTRTRQILMNGIEVEAWGFKHQFNRFMPDNEVQGIVSQIGRIENTQQITANWLGAPDQSVLETTLGYEQVAVDLTAWLAQNEPDKYVKETFDFGLLEDFDHLYRYSQFAYMTEGIMPERITQKQTEVVQGRPTQHHHNCNVLRLRRAYDKNTASPQTKVNILTLISAEQQTHNFYAEHGFMYADPMLRELYAEIKDVEEEHVTMYESLVDTKENMYEKLLLHEFTEVCNYYTCLEDETDSRIKTIWEMFFDMELGHLQIVADIFKKYEKRDPEEVIGSEIVIPNRFKSQKSYVRDVLFKEADKRLGADRDYTTISKLPEDWASYDIQNAVGKNGAPSETAIHLAKEYLGRDIVSIDKETEGREVELLQNGLQKKGLAPNTILPREYEKMLDDYEKKHKN